MTKSVLFICLGNICRSPMAEAVFAHLVQQRGLEGQWTCDSAALGTWHVGKGPDRRTMNVLKDKKLSCNFTTRDINPFYGQTRWNYELKFGTLAVVSNLAERDDKILVPIRIFMVEYSHRARQLKSDDFTKFDYIFGMDDENISELERRAPKSGTAKIELLGSYDPEGDVQIRDPYYDDDDKGFYKCYDQCLRSCTAFIDSVK